MNFKNFLFYGKIERNIDSMIKFYSKRELNNLRLGNYYFKY
ncbi:hypothetical protein HMPREF3189_00785 [Clostridiales bacterium KA00134]|nr:hypothetical protein HMPREF3189_00785 [Clostridiales bacterium KA00134]